MSRLVEQRVPDLGTVAEAVVTEVLVKSGDVVAVETGLVQLGVETSEVRRTPHAAVTQPNQLPHRVAGRVVGAEDDEVATVAQEVGYESEAAFARAFKRLMGQPPAEWRRSQGG